MSTLLMLIKRNVKLFFKDKGMFLTSLITPLILLVLYVAFLGNAYRTTFKINIPNYDSIPKNVIDGLVAGQLISSILAVSCVTVAFCSNFLMAQDKALGIIKDFDVTPVKSSVLALSYYLSTLISTLIICLIATALCLLYVNSVGWTLPLTDILFILLDVFLLVMFGTALSSIINFFLKSQGQISVVGTIVSSGYGFICGAYMPLSSFNSGLQKTLGFLPSTYATSLIRNHSMRSAMNELEKNDVSKELVKGLSDALDCHMYFYDKEVSELIMYLILIISTVVMIFIYILINRIRNKRIH